MKTVVLILEVVDFTCGHRKVRAVCSTQEVAEEWLEHNGGDQLVLCSDGGYMPKYVFEEREVAHNYNDVLY